jgi:hypothetical protein
VTTEQAGKVLYVVHRIGWGERYGGEGYYQIARESRDQPKRIQGRPVAAFTDRGRAEAFLRDQEVRITEGKDPTRYGDDPGGMTSIDDEDVFTDAMLDLGLTPPEVGEEGFRDWCGWWAELRPTLTPEQRAGLWRHLDRVHFFQIVEVPLS